MKTRFSSIDFDLRQLEIFRKVVELESFSKAGRAVYLAQASVSERIATLENMVGVKLLDRLGRKVVPNRAGELLYKHAVLLLDMKRTACLEMQEYLGMKRGEILMGGSTIPGSFILPKLIGRFREVYPLVTVTLMIADTSEIERRVLTDVFAGRFGWPDFTIERLRRILGDKAKEYEESRESENGPALQENVYQ